MVISVPLPVHITDIPFRVVTAMEFFWGGVHEKAAYVQSN